MSDIHSNEEKDKLLDHDYDGIKELNNPLPGWWLGTFYIAIVFAVIYFTYFQVLEKSSLKKEFIQNMAQAQELKDRYLGVKEINTDKIHEFATSEEARKKGETIFSKNCVSCHARFAEGNIGPNLTDDFWIHGNGTTETIAHTIMNGIPSKGMPTWGLQLLEDEIYAVAIYVRSLRGSTPANPKPPQGTEFKEAAE